MNAWLTMTSGDRIPLHGACVIGRSRQSQVVLPDPHISRRHTLIQQQNDREYWLVDLGSSNGTRLNGRRLVQPCRLKMGDLISVQEYEFRFGEIPRQEDDGSEQGVNTQITQVRTNLVVDSLTCWMFLVDIEGSTRLFQEVPSDELSQIVGGWLADCRNEIESVGGVVNKYLGDGLFAYIVEEADAASRVRQLAAIMAQRQGARNPPFRIVIHFAQVSVGNASAYGEENLFGSEMNFVFRFEKVAGKLKLPIALSDAASRRWVNADELTPLGEHPVPGFDGLHPVFEVKVA